MEGDHVLQRLAQASGRIGELQDELSEARAEAAQWREEAAREARRVRELVGLFRLMAERWEGDRERSPWVEVCCLAARQVAAGEEG
ncbi:MAG: hypothetical protein EBR73_12220 [Rhodobacteraceae bacterium]|jgi:hypothetical protein|nr:hypothetical protein [Paracoccaceae bacterium]